MPSRAALSVVQGVPRRLPVSLEVAIPQTNRDVTGALPWQSGPLTTSVGTLRGAAPSAQPNAGSNADLADVESCAQALLTAFAPELDFEVVAKAQKSTTQSTRAPLLRAHIPFHDEGSSAQIQLTRAVVLSRAPVLADSQPGLAVMVLSQAASATEHGGLNTSGPALAPRGAIGHEATQDHKSAVETAAHQASAFGATQLVVIASGNNCAHFEDFSEIYGIQIRVQTLGEAVADLVAAPRMRRAYLASPEGADVLVHAASALAPSTGVCGRSFDENGASVIEAHMARLSSVSEATAPAASPSKGHFLLGLVDLLSALLMDAGHASSSTALAAAAARTLEDGVLPLGLAGRLPYARYVGAAEFADAVVSRKGEAARSLPSFWAGEPAQKSHSKPALRCVG